MKCHANVPSYILEVLFVFLMIHRGQGSNVEIVECDINCKTAGSPVCAECNDEFRTFSSPCMVRRENQCYNSHCVIRSSGPCTDTPICETVCPLVYEPICSWNGNGFRTFSNLCQLNTHNRCAKDNFRPVAKCPCMEPVGQNSKTPKYEMGN